MLAKFNCPQERINLNIYDNVCVFCLESKNKGMNPFMVAVTEAKAV